jgi:hypothetical protein
MRSEHNGAGGSRKDTVPPDVLLDYDDRLTDRERAARSRQHAYQRSAAWAAFEDDTRQALDDETLDAVNDHALLAVHEIPTRELEKVETELQAIHALQHHTQQRLRATPPGRIRLSNLEIVLPPHASADRRHAWHQTLWDAVVDLTTRYPYLGPRIQSRWWERAADRELLATITTWRAALDELHENRDTPPEDRASAEWHFHRQLGDWAAYLNNTGRSSSHSAFNPYTDRTAFETYLDTSHVPAPTDGKPTEQPPASATEEASDLDHSNHKGDHAWPRP